MIWGDCEVDYCCYIVVGWDGILGVMDNGESDGKLMGIRIREGWWVGVGRCKKNIIIILFSIFFHKLTQSYINIITTISIIYYTKTLIFRRF